MPIPTITSVSSPALARTKSLINSNSSVPHSKSPSLVLMFSRIHLAPLISLSFNKGELMASSIADCALLSPSATALPRMATPPLRITVQTSAKSTLIWPLELIISVIHLAAVDSTSSALPNASRILRFLCCMRNLSLLITSKVSTCGSNSLMPFSAWPLLLGPSKLKGVVTIPTVRIPRSWQILAMMGAPPVPVPPPMPAHTKAILVLTSKILLISSRDSSVAWRPMEGFAPAPSPWVRCGPS